MHRFLSGFRLTTRVYTGFALLGCLAVLLSFAGMFAVGFIHSEYTKANNVIESVRRLSSLDTSLFSLNRSLFFFSAKGSEQEKQAALDALADFETRAADIEPYLDGASVKEKYNQTILASVGKYRADMEELFSTREKSVEAEERLMRFADQSSEKLTAMIEEATLPSATFALNNLQEQLDAVLRSVGGMGIAADEEIQKQLSDDLAALKKSSGAAKQAEMVNAKQLKIVLTALSSLDDEARKKIKFDKSLQDEAKAIGTMGEENSKTLKELVDSLVYSSAHLLAEAETNKLSIQKAFVLCAAFAGLLTAVISFLSLAGIKYPLARLVENAQEIARGDRAVYIHFTDRNDEIGILAKSLSVLLAYLKEVPSLPEAGLLGCNAKTYGTSLAYVPLGSPANAVDMRRDNFASVIENGIKDQENRTEIAYFGEGTGVDAESQLYQMLALVKHVGTSAAVMTQDAMQQFESLRSYLSDLTDFNTKLTEGIENLKQKAATPLPEQISELIGNIVSVSEGFLASSEKMEHYVQEGVESSRNVLHFMGSAKHFTSGLFSWAQLMAGLCDSVKKAADQTKLLALNAAIESAKTGEKAKIFAGIASEIRGQAQQTTVLADQLSSNLNDMQNEAYAFAEKMDEINHEIQVINAAGEQAVSAVIMQKSQSREINDAAVLFSSCIHDAMHVYRDFEPEAEQMLFLARTAKEILPSLYTATDTIQHALTDFVDDLPSYEEEAENNDTIVADKEEKAD